ncbi:heme-thiolate peroxidase [Crepidotus variabilis]|uniref:Heme-thiolate peroxidase n=1 Tax=Crepidotus variabilis TaxID=179855 RepID=A0A9P6EL35_9AGAR|nr:heme-thiolate peroxidase [Crepidotus variabilis]
MFIVQKIFQDLYVLSWDVALTVVNLLSPKRKIGHVTPAGHPGADGKWPEFVPPKDGDSRCSCPALNAMANHGILPHDGKNIKFTELGSLIRTTYNFAPSFCYFVPNYAANMLNRSYSKDSFDLVDLDLHNGIEHDASLTREDSALVPDQSKPHLPFVKELLSLASGKDAEGNPLLTPKDLSEYSTKRRVDARLSNPNFTLSKFHKMFGSSNSSTMLTIFGGRIKDLEAVLIDERLPDSWESRIVRPMGLTMMTFNKTVLAVEKGINEQKYEAKLKAAAQPETNVPEASSG